MPAISKKLKLNRNILLEWVYDSNNIVTENYSVITNLNESSRNFISKSAINLNNIDNSFFTIDPVLYKYAKIDTAKFNFLQQQDYTSSPIQYDTVRIYFPTSYDFTTEGYEGVMLKLSAYDFTNKKLYPFSNFIGGSYIFFKKNLEIILEIIARKNNKPKPIIARSYFFRTSRNIAANNVEISVTKPNIKCLFANHLPLSLSSIISPIHENQAGAPKFAVII